MKRVLSVDAMRQSDAYTIAHFVGSKELMERAGRAVFDVLNARVLNAHVLNDRRALTGCDTTKKENSYSVAVVCGSGNNAGDGYVLARLLHEAGADCTVIRTTEKCSEDGRHFYDACVRAGVPVEELYSGVPDFSGYDCIVDCLLGTGFRSAPKEDVLAIIQAINRSGAYVVSVDINSGLNGDNGLAKELQNVRTSRKEYACVVSDLTISVAEYQPGHFLGMAKDVMKDKDCVDIGIVPTDDSCRLVEGCDFSGVFAPRRHDSHKGDYGYIALVGGSAEYSGAIRLAAMANAAMRAGAGVVRLAAPRGICSALMPDVLEVTLFPLGNETIRFVREEVEALMKNTRSLAFGMGIGLSDGARQILEYLLQHYKGTLIVDADGLTLLSQLEDGYAQNRTCTLLLTPHVKELARLLHCEVSDIRNAPIEMAKEAARRWSAAVLLKGAATIVTDGARTFLVDAGCPGMATAGSGDVLSGILAALCANIPNMDFSGIEYPSGMHARQTPFSANRDECRGECFSEKERLLLTAALGAFVNGRAGERAQEEEGDFSMIASDTVARIPSVIRELRRKKEQ